MELIRVTGKAFLYQNTRSNYWDSIFCLCKLRSIYKISVLVNFGIYKQNIENKVLYHKKLKYLIFTFRAGKRLKSSLNVKRDVSNLFRVCDITGSWNVVSELILFISFIHKYKSKKWGHQDFNWSLFQKPFFQQYFSNQSIYLSMSYLVI